MTLELKLKQPEEAAEDEHTDAEASSPGDRADDVRANMTAASTHATTRPGAEPVSGPDRMESQSTLSSSDTSSDSELPPVFAQLVDPKPNENAPGLWPING